MLDAARRLRLGEATVSLLNAGDSLWSLAETLAVPESAWRPRYAALFERPLLFPSYAVHIALPGASILIDAGRYSFPPDSPQRPPLYTPPPDLDAQLAALGIAASDVTHLVVTHLHADHYDATTVACGETYVPRFPNARCFIGRADWQGEEVQRGLDDPLSLEACTLGVLWRAGLVELVEGDRDLVSGVRIIAAPGESPGHQIVRVHFPDQTLYCIGDLYHHPIEVERPEWMCEWCDPVAMDASRRALTRAALAEDALLVAAHIGDIGRLQRTLSGVLWTSM